MGNARRAMFGLPRVRLVAAAATSTALLTTAVTGGLPGAGAAQDPGPQAATAAKKKCNKKCLKKRAIRFIRGHSFTFDTGFSPRGHRTLESYDFCRNGTLRAQGDYTGFQGRSQTSVDGTWRVKKSQIVARENIVTLAVTYDNVQHFVIEGEPSHHTPFPPDYIELVKAGFLLAAYDDSGLARRGPGAC
jgi:hypothetical protein